MRNKSTLYIVIALVCAAVLFVLFYFYSPDDKKAKTEKPKVERKPNDWYQKFGHRNLHPYGTFIFYQLLRQQNSNIRTLKRNSQYKSLDTITGKRRLYVYVGKKFETHYKRLDKILGFVKRGNDAFIAADVFPAQVKSIISDYYNIDRSYYRNAPVNFIDTTLQSPYDYNFKFIFKRKNIYRYWTDFERAEYEYDTYDPETTEPVIYEKNSVTLNPVFISIPYGEGMLYLHTLPYSFTNIVMKRERGVEHAERVISCLPDEPIVFDSYLNSNSNGNEDGSNKGQAYKRTSPLQFILGNRSLRWSYYLLLAALLLYILFKGKRKQKIIPPKETLENTSVEYADTMSKLYLQYGEHKYIVYQQEKNLINYIRSKYYIHTREVDEDYILRVATKSGIEKDRIAHLFNRFNNVKKIRYATANDVVEIYAEIEYFYKNCK